MAFLPVDCVSNSYFMGGNIQELLLSFLLTLRCHLIVPKGTISFIFFLVQGSILLIVYTTVSYYLKIVRHIMTVVNKKG